MIDFTKYVTPVDFNSSKVKKQMKKVKEEIKKVMDGQKIDTSKLHIKFNQC